MSRFFLHLTVPLLLSFIYAQAAEVGIGALCGWRFLQGDAKIFWEGSPCMGMAISKDISHSTDVTLSIAGSYHTPLNPDLSVIPAGYLSTSLNVLLVSFDLQVRRSFLENPIFTPIFSFGVCNSMFVSYYSFPPPENSDESEIGVKAGLGCEKEITQRLGIDIGYYQKVVFTEPRIVGYGAVLMGVHYTSGLNRKPFGTRPTRRQMPSG